MEIKTYYIITFKDLNGQQIFGDHKAKKLFLRMYEYWLKDTICTYAWSLLPKKGLFMCGLQYELKNDLPNREILLYQKSHFRKLVSLFHEYLKEEKNGDITFDAEARPLEDYPKSFLAGFTAYIHCLPVFLGLADNFVDYGWSSYLPLLHQKHTFLHHKSVMSWFGGAKEYQKFHHQMLEVKKARDVCGEIKENF